MFKNWKQAKKTFRENRNSKAEKSNKYYSSLLTIEKFKFNSYQKEVLSQESEVIENLICLLPIKSALIWECYGENEYFDEEEQMQHRRWKYKYEKW